MKEYTDSLLQKAKEFGADLVGIAPIERFAGIPEQHHPSSIFPEAKSVIVLGRRITRGTIRGIEEGTQFDLYNLYGYAWLEDRFLSMLTFKVCEYLEDNRWEAVPLFNLPVETPVMGIPVRPGRPAPNVTVDFNDAAIRAGIGEINYLRLFITKEFGPLQRFQIILTDAALEGSTISLEPVSDAKPEMAGFCPLKAIDTTKEETLEICGKKMKMAAVNYNICASCKNGALANRYHPAGKPDRIAAFCSRSMLEYMEKHHQLATEFKNPFRIRKAWAIQQEQAHAISFGSEIE
jgi:epoxyqueuosine reductase QueG